MKDQSPAMAEFVRQGARRLLVVTPQVMAEMAAQAEAWIENRAALRDDVLKAMMIHAQIMDKIIRRPPKGRPGLNAALKAVPLYKDTMGNVLGALRQRDKEKLTALPEAPREPDGKAEPDRPTVRDGGRTAEPASPDRAGPAGEADRVVDGEPVGVPHR